LTAKCWSKISIQLRAVLVEVCDFQLGTDVDTPAIGLQLAEHQLRL
jgi:hypothetical protein